ncbi:MAG TPA: methyltransferase domain-containing protein [Candidatus Dormibacteraeota bacterium]
MGPRRDVERFDRWAETYDSHWMQRRIFEPVQSTVLDLGQAMVPAPRAVLDVGCGTGRLLKAASHRFPDAELAGVDPAPEMVRHARMAAGDGSAIQFREASAEALPFPDGQFELVFSTLTFHHWGDQRGAIKEIARVLAPTGHWILADFLATGLMRPIRRLLRMNRFPQRKALDAMLAPAGLGVVSTRPVAGLLGQVSALAIARRP